jgi:hypothetical protein
LAFVFACLFPKTLGKKKNQREATQNHPISTMPRGNPRQPPPEIFHADRSQNDRVALWELVTVKERKVFVQKNKLMQAAIAKVAAGNAPTEVRNYVLNGGRTRHASREARLAVKSANLARRKRGDRLQAALQAVADGTASNRKRLFAESGGRALHGTPEAAAAAYVILRKAVQDRRSAQTLADRLKYSTGCITEGCLLAAEHHPMLTLLEQHHRDPTTKILDVWSLYGEARMIELPKTDCLCAWHHYLETAAAYEHNSNDEVENGRLEVRLARQGKGCEHPYHNQMPYAPLVPVAPVPVRMLGFFHVSHVRLGVKRSTQPTSPEQIEDLESGAAVVHCKFCHLFWGLCERNSLFTSPYLSHELGRLLRLSPAFIVHFHERTTGFDWAERRFAVVIWSRKG